MFWKDHVDDSNHGSSYAPLFAAVGRRVELFQVFLFLFFPLVSDHLKGLWLPRTTFHEPLIKKRKRETHVLSSICLITLLRKEHTVLSSFPGAGHHVAHLEVCITVHKKSSPLHYQYAFKSIHIFPLLLFLSLQWRYRCNLISAPVPTLSVSL